MKTATAADIVLILANALVWGIPTAIYTSLVIYQFRDGNGSLFLIAIGPLPYAIGLVLSTLGVAFLLRRGAIVGARLAGIVCLVMGLPLSACGILMLGST